MMAAALLSHVARILACHRPAGAGGDYTGVAQQRAPHCSIGCPRRMMSCGGCIVLGVRAGGLRAGGIAEIHCSVQEGSMIPLLRVGVQRVLLVALL